MRDMASINCNEICPVILLSPLVGGGAAGTSSSSCRCRVGELFPGPYSVSRVRRISLPAVIAVRLGFRF